jgi:hypothetical protein
MGDAASECNETAEAPAEIEAWPALAATLGMPQGSYGAITLPGSMVGQQWADWVVWWFGLNLTGTPEPWEGPLWQWLTDVAEPIVLQGWLIQARLRGSDPFVEKRWHPVLGERVSMHGLANVRKKSDIVPLVRGLHLLQQMSRAGRPDRKSDSHSHTRRALVAEARRLKGKHPTLAMEKIAARIGVSYETLRDWLDDFPEAQPV